MKIRTDDYENKLIYEQSLHPDGINKITRANEKDFFDFTKLKTTQRPMMKLNTVNRQVRPEFRQKQKPVRKEINKGGLTFGTIMILVITIMSIIFEILSLF